MIKAVTLYRNANNNEIEALTPIDPITSLPNGDTTYSVVFPVDLGGGPVPIRVTLPVKTVQDAFDLLLDKARFRPLLQAAAEETMRQMRERSAAMAANQPMIVKPR